LAFFLTNNITAAIIPPRRKEKIIEKTANNGPAIQPTAEKSLMSPAPSIPAPYKAINSKKGINQPAIENSNPLTPKRTMLVNSPDIENRYVMEFFILCVLISEMSAISSRIII
jgi:hypothetical protein